MNTYKQQFDKLTEAYINLQVEPFDACGCFIGNLLDNTDGWLHCRDVIYNSHDVAKNYMEVVPTTARVFKVQDEGYNNQDIMEVEKVFMVTYIENHPDYLKTKLNLIYLAENLDEDALFLAFEAALEKLKEVHIAKGENVEELVFTKRKLEAV